MNIFSDKNYQINMKENTEKTPSIQKDYTNTIIILSIIEGIIIGGTLIWIIT